MLKDMDSYHLLEIYLANIRPSTFCKQKYQVQDFNVKTRFVKVRVSVRGTNDAIRINKKLTFKENAPIRSCISKINSTHL